MKKPKIIIWDLETLPCPKRVYDILPSVGAWPGRTFKAELHDIISFGFKELGGKSQCVNLWEVSDSWNQIGKNDEALVQIIYDTLHDADEIVTHNGKRFDVKMLNTRLMRYGFPPLPKMNHVDTKTILSSNLTLYSNSLDNAAKFFNCKVHKMKINDKWGMWRRMAFAEDTAQDRKVMDLYCKRDVDTLEQLYLKTRPLHGSNSINKNHWVDAKSPVCPTCGSKKLQKNGTRRTVSQTYQRYICNDCGTTSRTDKKDLNPRSY